MKDYDKQKAISILNRIMEAELAGVVRYTHYSLMVYGPNRIPLADWMRANAQEGLMHAQKAGEMVTLLGGHPSLKIGELLETERHDIDDILTESLEHEKAALDLYYDLLKLAESAAQSVLLEEYACQQIAAEEQHLDEVNKMLRKPGDILCSDLRSTPVAEKTRKVQEIYASKVMRRQQRLPDAVVHPARANG